MVLERDNQEIIAAVSLGLFQLETGQTYTSGAIDTKGFRSLSFVINHAAGLLHPNNVIYLGAQESVDGLTWTQVATIKLLPSEKYPHQDLVIPLSPYIQTMGVVCAERYIRFYINAVAVVAGEGDDLTLFVMGILFPEQRAFRGWDPMALLGDGQP
jgi:hypothetical protein